MSSPTPKQPAQSNASTLLTRHDLAPALEIDVFDRDGKAQKLGELTEGKRTVLVFIRHFCKVPKLADGWVGMVLTTTSQGV
jgi:hypothetical protein